MKKNQMDLLSPLHWEVVKMIAQRVAQKNIKVYDSEVLGQPGQAFTNEQLLAVPRRETFPNAEGLAFHEGCHHAANSFAADKDTGEKICPKNAQIGHYVLNAIDDPRVNLFGKESNPGYHANLEAHSITIIKEHFEELKKVNADFDNPSQNCIQVIMQLIAYVAGGFENLVMDHLRDEKGKFLFAHPQVGRILGRLQVLMKNITPTSPVTDSIFIAREMCNEIDNWIQNPQQPPMPPQMPLQMPQNSQSQQQQKGQGQGSSQNQKSDSKKPQNQQSGGEKSDGDKKQNGDKKQDSKGNGSGEKDSEKKDDQKGKGSDGKENQKGDSDSNQTEENRGKNTKGDTSEKIKDLSEAMKDQNQQGNQQQKGNQNQQGSNQSQQPNGDPKSDGPSKDSLPDSIKRAIDKTLEEMSKGKSNEEIKKDLQKELKNAKNEMKKAMKRAQKGMKQLDRAIKQKYMEDAPKPDMTDESGFVETLNGNDIPVEVRSTKSELSRENNVNDPDGVYNAVLDENYHEIRTLQREFEKICTNQKILRNRRKGHINARAIPRFLTDQHFNRPFQRNIPEQGASVLILVDESGSMGGSSIRAARKAAIVLMEAIKNTNIDLCVLGFAANGGEFEIVEKRYKKFGERLEPEKLGAMSVSNRFGVNRDGSSILKASEHFKDVPKNNAKIMIVISDGSPNHGYNGVDNYVGKIALEDTGKNVIEVKAKGIHTFAISIDSRGDSYLSDIYGPEFYFITRASEIDDAVQRLVKAIARTIKR